MVVAMAVIAMDSLAPAVVIEMPLIAVHSPAPTG